MAGISTSASWSEWNPLVVAAMVREAVTKGAEHTVKQAQQNLAAGGHDDTGTLSNSIHAEVTSYGFLGSQAYISADAPYASFVDQGVEGYIYPKTASVLKFKPGRKGSYLGKRGQYNSKPTGRFSSDYLYRPRVKGQAATHFFTNAVNGLSLTDFI